VTALGVFWVIVGAPPLNARLHGKEPPVWLLMLINATPAALLIVALIGPLQDTLVIVPVVPGVIWVVIGGYGALAVMLLPDMTDSP
jgi:hypothetical protein